MVTCAQPKEVPMGRNALVFPDAEALAAIGPNRMDSTRRPQAMEAGRQQGKALAAATPGMWWVGAGV